MRPRVLVTGMGNDLRGDDGFGIAAARRFEEAGMPEGVSVYEAGIGGIGLVQELMSGYEVLVVLDATERGDPPGTVRLLEAEVPDLESLTGEDRREFLADTHYAVPSKALILAQALGVLPPSAYILGCQPGEQGLVMGLSPPVERGVAEAVERLREFLARPGSERITP